MPASFRALTVDIAEVELEDVRIPIQVQGTVTPLRETRLVSEVNGKIVAVSPSFIAGGFVSAGETLVRIDDRDYRANLLHARAALESAESNLAQEKGRVEVAFNEWQNLPKNSQRSHEATDLYLRKLQLELTEAQLLSAQADLSKAGKTHVANRVLQTSQTGTAGAGCAALPGAQGPGDI